MTRRRCEPRTRNANAPTGARPPSALFEVHSLCVIAEEPGWRGEDAFFAAMVMHLNGIEPSQTARLFQEANRWIQ